MFRRLSHIARHRLFSRITPLVTLLAATPVARAEMAEESLQQATDSNSTHLFTLNPAVLTPKGLQGGALLLRQSRTSSLDHTGTGGDKLSTEVQDEYECAALLVDLGAGAGLGVSHQLQFHKAETSDETSKNGRSLAETVKIQRSTLRLMVELTTELHAAINIRYLYRDTSIFGDPFMSPGEETRYKTTMVGYGSGFVYQFKNAAAAYTYYPPLRGKTDVEGEEKIVVEPGQIGFDGYFEARKDLVVGLLAKRWLNEVDDLASGTTAADNQTKISLYGLDPDQYLFRKQLIMLGADWSFNKQAALRFSIGQELADLNFKDLLIYSRAGVRQRGSGNEELKYNRYRAMLRFGDKGVEADAGLGIVSRKYDFSDDMNGGSYKADAKELFATIGMKL